MTSLNAKTNNLLKTFDLKKLVKNIFKEEQKKILTNVIDDTEMTLIKMQTKTST